MSINIGFIGAGNMGGALAKAVSTVTKDIGIADHFHEKAETLSNELGVTCSDNQTLAKEADYLFLGVKPQMMEEMLSGIKELLKARTTPVVLISMAAGLSIETVRSFLGFDAKMIRIMPNTPVAVGEGEILYSKSENTTDEELDKFLAFMKNAGQLTAIDESLMDAGCALSGCGPAFVYCFLRALRNGGIQAGLDEATATALARQTLVGAAKLQGASDLPLETLIDNVCSPGGSTIEGVKTLEKNEMEQIVEDAVMASFKRNRELGKRD